MTEELRAQIEELRAQVIRNTKALTDTGELVLDLQIQNQRRDLESLDLRAASESSSSGTHANRGAAGRDKQGVKTLRQDPGSAAAAAAAVANPNAVLTQADIIDLVTELQGQLDMLDERSVRRTANVFVMEDNDAIAPLPGRDGLPPAEELHFPKTLKEFKDLDDAHIEYWLRWYELLPPDENELEQILKDMGTSINEVGAEVPAKQEISDAEWDSRYDTLARFLGLRNRRTPGAW